MSKMMDPGCYKVQTTRIMLIVLTIQLANGKLVKPKGKNCLILM